MASGLKTTSGNHFEATYEHPWGGVASDADPEDIQPNQFQTCTGLNIKSGILAACSYDNLAAYTGLQPNANVLFMFSIGISIYALDNLGNTYTFSANTFTLDQSDSTCTNASCIQIVQGVVYIFSYSANAEFVYTPGVSFVIGQAFVAGKYCTVLDQYLITANSVQPSDSPSIKANRVSWSSPDGFTTFDPSVDRSAGYDTLADVKDYISGVFTMGNVGFILRSQGITQMTPTGVGIQPFDFTPLWTSTYGIGCTYPTSFAQYGPLAIWANDNNIYLFTGSAIPTGITGSAKAAIYSDLLASQVAVTGSATKTYVLGAIGAQSVNRGTNSLPIMPTPDLEYTLAIVTVRNRTIGAGSFVNVVFWTYKIDTQQWTRTTKSIDAGSGNIFASVNLFFGGVYYAAQAITTTADQTFCALCNTLCLGYTKSGVTQQAIIVKYQAGVNVGVSYGINSPNPSPFNLTFKQEDIKVNRKPQVRIVAIKAYGDPSTTSTLQVQVGNVSFSSITIAQGSSKQTYLSFGIFTGEDPQVSITSANFSGCIVKVVMAGTYADGELA